MATSETSDTDPIACPDSSRRSHPVGGAPLASRARAVI